MKNSALAKVGSCIYLLFLIVFTYSCQNSDKATKTGKLFQPKSSDETGIDFENIVENSEQLNIFNYRNFYNGGGVGIGDINNDSLPDIYFTANMGPNKLFLNKGNWQFEDITADAGVAAADKWSTGVVFVDINADGYLDIYVCNAGYTRGEDQRNQLYINNGDLTFREEAKTYGLDDNGYTTHAAFFDQDKDGDLDVYILNNSFIPTNTLNYSNKRELKSSEWPVKDFLKGGGDKFLRNENGTYVDASDEAGIYQSLIGFGLGVTVGDVNRDGYEDLYISNDFFERDYLYINDQKGGFEESLESYFSHVSHSSMGADMRDINNDGYADIFVTDMLPRDEYRLKTTSIFDDINLRRLKVEQGFYHQYMHNTLQYNTGAGKFKDICFQAGTASSDWSWGALMFDADNDGWTDLYVCNGVYHDVIDLDFMDFFANDVLQKMALTGEKEELQKIVDEMPSVPLVNPIFRNQGGINFQQYNNAWGLDETTFSNGAAYGDLDGDGDYDLVVSNVNQPCIVYENTTDNPSTKIMLNGPSNNPFGIGTKIYLHVGDNTQYYELHPSRGFQSSVDYQVIFGQIDGHLPDSVVVVWSDGNIQKLYDITLNHLNISYEKNNVQKSNLPDDTWYTEVKENDFHQHQEDDYVDFFNERGLYRMLSREGPAAAVADINGDGFDDVFIGGAKDEPSQLYIYSRGKYVSMAAPTLSDDAVYEDTYATFVDIDNDGDMDLCVGSGGNHLPPNHEHMRDRLYLNDGHGNFLRSQGWRVKEGMNTAVITPWDFDQDGDMDLFVGSRSVPQHYGYTPLHFLLENDGSGNLHDVGSSMASDFNGLGMVTDAEAADINGDGRKELIVVGTWAAPTVFQLQGDTLAAQPTQLEEKTGWYYSIATADVDSDGDIDMILGNTGTNTYLESRSKGEWNLWVNDFDNNGFVDKVISYDIDGKDIPMHQKKDILDQIISLRKENLKHVDYATRTIQDIFTPAQLQKSKKYSTRIRTSYVALNDGEGHFSIQLLPTESQLSSVHAILPMDIDSDGDIDLITGGNDYHFLPQLSRLDASFGGLLVNNGQGEYTFIKERLSGILVNGEIKNILPLEKNQLLFIRNDEAPILYISNMRLKEL